MNSPASGLLLRQIGKVAVLREEKIKENNRWRKKPKIAAYMAASCITSLGCVRNTCLVKFLRISGNIGGTFICSLQYMGSCSSVAVMGSIPEVVD